MTTTNQILNQIEVERLAREANKVYCITALVNGSEEFAVSYDGALDAAEDMAFKLWRDLKALADKINREKWNDESRSNHHGSSNEIGKGEVVPGTGRQVGDEVYHASVQAEQTEGDRPGGSADA